MVIITIYTQKKNKKLNKNHQSPNLLFPLFLTNILQVTEAVMDEFSNSTGTRKEFVKQALQRLHAIDQGLSHVSLIEWLFLRVL